MKIMLDAGHYGNYNRSPACPEYWESHMTWTLCRLLRAELEKRGVEVGVTRTDQKKDMEVYQRGRCASGYDVFISLHSNATGVSVNENVDHPVVYRLAKDTDIGERLAKRIADKIAVLMSTKQSGRTATRVQTSGDEYYGVLRGAKAVGCPHAFIIEHSFHTATAPARWLSDDTNLALLAREEAKIIAEIFGIGGKENDMKEVEVLQKEIEELKKSIAELEAKQEKTYHYWSELPKWAYNPLMALYDGGYFAGASASDLNISHTKLEMLVILARTLKKLGKIEYD